MERDYYCCRWIAAALKLICHWCEVAELFYDVASWLLSLRWAWAPSDDPDGVLTDLSTRTLRLSLQTMAVVLVLPQPFWASLARCPCQLGREDCRSGRHAEVLGWQHGWWDAAHLAGRFPAVSPFTGASPSTCLELKRRPGNHLAPFLINEASTRLSASGSRQLPVWLTKSQCMEAIGLHRTTGFPSRFSSCWENVPNPD